MTQDIFIYDEINRNHTLNGISIPSVTQILQPLSNYDIVPMDRLYNACNFGLALHKTIELYLLDKLDESILDPALKASFIGFRKWYCNYSEILGFVPAAVPAKIEIAEYNKKLRYCGKPDLVFTDAIIDFKSRKFNPIVDPLQMAGYDGFFPNFPPRKLFVLEIDLEGNTKLVNAYRKQAWGIYRKMLEFHHKQIEFNELLENYKKEK